MRSASAVGPGRVYVRVHDARAAPTLEAFPCAALCMECRFVADPTQAGDPMRTDGKTDRRDPCPRCGANAWADLRNRETAAMVAEVDEVDSIERAEHRHRRIIRSILWTAVMGGLAAVLWGVPIHRYSDALWGVAFLVAIVGPFVGLPLLTSASGRSYVSDRRRTPARWHLPAAAIPKRRGPSSRGPARADSVLRAPLTGRPCVAYELAIRGDDHPRAAPSTWSLIEQRNTDMVVGDRRIGRDRATLVATRQRVDADEMALDEDQLRRVLRSRGLDPANRHVFYETIVTAEDEARAWQPANEPARLEIG